MTFPEIYNHERVGKLYAPDVAGATKAGQNAGLPGSSGDGHRLLLMLVDPQVDFVHEDGSLSVPGAVADTRRTIEWIYTHMGSITTIAASLDTHTPLQIFYPEWWVDEGGNHPSPFTMITADDVANGVWSPTTEQAWSRAYVHTLEETAQKVLTIWPHHTMLGTPGHAIAPTLYEAMVYHAAARQTRPVLVSKGYIAKTEHYSILEPEVKVADHPIGGINLDLLHLIESHDLVYFAGQAKSHCVLETIQSLVRVVADRNPDAIRNWRVLMDCTSSVVHPAVDFEAIASTALAELARDYGLVLTTSEEAL